MNCKFCDNLLCLRCIQPEVHSCANLRRMKDDLIKKLELKLSSERCVKSKIESI
jgi:predicted nucleic acid binding AN1-type Zn finger protein